MSNDFRATQIQTKQVIASGSLANGTGAKLVVYPIEAQSSPNNTGLINQSTFNTSSLNGADIFLYVSGGIGQKNTTNRSITVFGGDVHISGNMTIDGSGGGGGSSVQWVEGSPAPRLRTTASVAIGSGSNFAENIGTDVFFFVSGTANQYGLNGVTDSKFSVFGGDTIISGNIQTGFFNTVDTNLVGLNTIIGGATNLITQSSAINSIVNSVSSSIENYSNSTIINSSNVNIVGSDVGLDFTPFTFAAIINSANGSISGSSVLSSIISADASHISSSTYSTIIGGTNNQISNQTTSSILCGGDSNQLSYATYTGIVGGDQHFISNSFESFIGGGFGNVIINGSDNIILGSSEAGIINSGDSVVINSNGSAVLGGSSNGGLFGGTGNLISGSNECVIIGGINNKISNSIGCTAISTYKPLTTLSNSFHDVTSSIVIGLNFRVTNSNSIYIGQPTGSVYISASNGFNLESGNLNISDGIKYNPRIITANYTITSSDYIIASSASSGITATLPTSPTNGQTHIIKEMIGITNNVLVSSSNYVIDGLSTYTIAGGYGSVTITYFGSGFWGII